MAIIFSYMQFSILVRFQCPAEARSAFSYIQYPFVDEKRPVGTGSQEPLFPWNHRRQVITRRLSATSDLASKHVISKSDIEQSLCTVAKNWRVAGVSSFKVNCCRSHEWNISGTLIEMFVTLVAVLNVLSITESFGLPSYEPVGCFGDSGIFPRPLPRLLRNYRPHMNWNDIGSVIAQCAGLANQNGYRFFGVQFYGECWSGPNAHATYGRDGAADHCVSGVGAAGANFVYKFHSGDNKVPGCPLNWIGLSGSCFHVLPDANPNKQAAEKKCKEEEQAKLLLARNEQDGTSMSRLIQTMEINKSLNITCLLLGEWRVNFTVFPEWCEPVNVSLPSGLWLNSVNSTYACAVRASDKQWYRLPCQLNTCSAVCTQSRDISPKSGSFTQTATGAALMGHVISTLLVRNPVECAQECLLYVDCKSFNFQYSPSSPHPQHLLLCELNNDVHTDTSDEFIALDGYKYYERLS